ncbi:MAG: ARMT1-like domain-containing protein [bacterium]
MKSQPECLACMFRQALNTARAASPDPTTHTRILKELARLLPAMDMTLAPATLSKPIYDTVFKVTGIRDPYARHKKETNQAAMELLPGLEATIRRSKDPLKTAIHLAAAGNIIDLGIGHKFDLKKDVVRIMKQAFTIDDYKAFRKELKPGCKLLYLGDNCGEIIFDRILVEQLLARGANVTFVVKSGPIINDATREDAVFAGISAICPVIETGSDDIGVGWPNTSPEFRKHIRQADIILAKGHGNFETCFGRPGNYYFLLKAKCDIVSAELGVKTGATVFKRVKP